MYSDWFSSLGKITANTFDVSMFLNEVFLGPSNTCPKFWNGCTPTKWAHSPARRGGALNLQQIPGAMLQPNLLAPTSAPLFWSGLQKASLPPAALFSAWPCLPFNCASSWRIDLYTLWLDQRLTCGYVLSAALSPPVLCSFNNSSQEPGEVTPGRSWTGEEGALSPLESGAEESW